jgi:hypothetical protein
MRIDVRPYRDLAPTEMGEWKRLAKKAHPPGGVRLGSDLRWADLAPETDYLVRLWDEDELRACAWVTQRTVSISVRETPSPAFAESPPIPRNDVAGTAARSWSTRRS